MIRDWVTVDDALAVLNRAVASDPEAISALLEQRVPCNKALADDPTIQVASKDGAYHVGILGILNGIFGTDEDGWGPIAASMTDGVVDGFERVTDRTKGKVKPAPAPERACGTEAPTLAVCVAHCTKTREREVREARMRAETPDGTPYVRDVLARCKDYEPGEPDGDCGSREMQEQGDGHYLCAGCRRAVRVETPRRAGGE